MRKKLFNEAILEYNLVSENFPEYSKILLNLGGIALEQNKYKKAISYYLKFESLAKKQNPKYYKSVESSFIHDLGLSYFHLSEFTNAEKYLLKSHSIQNQKQDTSVLIRTSTDLGNLYYEQYKDNLAIPYFLKAYNLAKNFHNLNLKMNTALNMAVVEENRKDFQKAIFYRKKFEIWKDSINDQNKVWEIASLEKKHAIAEKQKEIQLLELENQIKNSEKNKLILISILLLIVLTTILIFYIQKSKINKIISIQKEALNKSNNTKDKLLSVLSHDLRTSVNTLQEENSKLLENLNEKNYQIVKEIALKNSAISSSTYSLLDNLLHWISLQNDQLYFHIDSVDLYSVTKQIEYYYTPFFTNKNISFENLIPKANFIYADLDSLKIILRNLLDNALKFTNTYGKITIKTYSSENDNFQYLVIEDSGVGISEEKIDQLLKDTNSLQKKGNQKGIGTGLGIQLCKSMTKKNQGIFKIESVENEGTKMIVGFKKVKNG
ncbi:tetratricopeptide repeat-containing sensor histidine kinase [Aureivirga sp. CE67]|uniref:tetratricopeptide repeat-containing sensor histidine kinase n=1 Tax=Aureivirga sp. CE67 TaxID=1788983 RepID=UPI0018CB9E01|nr:tetratricopeptide repeat-containing sensor histidine kinase [Aureivirga sp. CE67]